MANEIKYQGISVTGWTSTFNPLKKGPVVGKRIWSTLADFEDYIDNPKDSAIPGLVVTVVNDGENNGAYVVKTAAGYNGETRGSWVKLATGEEKQLVVDGTATEGDNPPVVYAEGNLTIQDMRTYWDDQSFN